MKKEEAAESVPASHPSRITPEMLFSGNFGGYGKPAKKAETDYEVGQEVEHKKFGRGMILSVTPQKDDVMLEIAFEKCGTKTLMSSFAPLVKK